MSAYEVSDHLKKSISMKGLAEYRHHGQVRGDDLDLGQTKGCDNQDRKLLVDGLDCLQPRYHPWKEQVNNTKRSYHLCLDEAKGLLIFLVGTT